MEHELLHNESDVGLKLTNKTKKEKEKVDQGEKKKWNFRKTTTASSDTVGKQSPSPTSGLINPSSDPPSKRDTSQQMIFENQITTDNDCENVEHRLQSPPIPITSPPPGLHASPRSVSFDHQTNNNKKRLSQQTQSLSTSPPALARPSRKPIERIFRQSSCPASSPIHHSSKLNYQQTPVNETFSTPATHSQSENHAKPRLHSTSDIQWQSVQQNLFSQSSETQDDALLSRIASDNETPGACEAINDSNMMWQQESKQAQELVHGNWTNFSSIPNEVFVAGNQPWRDDPAGKVKPDDDDENGRESPIREVASNSSSSRNSSEESDNDEETEESVWKITEEQRTYYLNQFKVLQPAGKGVVTGQKAREFFLKSGLSTDVLSRIWNLADLDSDGALNFEEFCIAMHIVVAVRHGLDVPTTLSPFLLPEQYEKQQVNQPATDKTTTQKNGTRDQLPLPDSPKTWARFSPDPEKADQTAAALPEEEPGKVCIAEVQPVVQAAAVQGQHSEKPMSDSNSADESTQSKDSNQPARKTSLGIPRVRGTVKQTNLLDQPHWAILPPPSKFTKDAEDSMKSVPIGTIIPDDTPDKDNRVPPVLLKVENIDKPSSQDSESDSSSSEEENKKERPKSATAENLESGSSSPRLSQGSSHDSGVNQDSVDAARKANTAPVPPPRKKTGHSRSSSLDLQKLFNNKGGSNSFQPTLDSSFDKSKKHKSLCEENLTNNGTENKESNEQSRESQENFADFSTFENTATSTANHLTENNISRHRRSASLDSNHAIWIEASPPKQQSNWELQVKDPVTTSHPQATSASLPRPVPKKKPSSPPPPLRQKKESQQDSGSDGLMVDKERKPNKEPIHFVVKPLTRLEQLHARIRDLKAKNTTLSRVNNELQQEFKEMMEKRIELESQIEQHKPLSNG